jgi:PH-interacting protein
MSLFIYSNHMVLMLGKSGDASSSAVQVQPINHQILCCAFNANGTVFVTGSSDTFARVCFLLSTILLHPWSDFTTKRWISIFHQKCWFQVWNACKSSSEEHDQPNHEMDVLSGHENDVNYVQFSGCVRSFSSDNSHTSKEENNLKLRNSWSVLFLVMRMVFHI